MQNPAILYPVFALAAWTFLVLLLIPFYRVRAGLRREIKPDDFKYGESATVPPYVSIPNRNYMNLLELPMLFYVVCVLLYVTAGGSSIAIKLAWAYVVLRVIHSIIHLSYNKVMHRLTAFAVSNFVLGALWVVAGIHVASNS
ncbi:MAG TPA: MAPEG family protein [Arenimonas sp.]|nr:MAPEG family protein [Arenimonas sp.]HOZ05503.1 MAPEG family protein [Arenimonas sp.]HPO25069.1 MAPEG family protein [Arenimonas sp.]HPW32009.1 MAPEG family protein [Arenimonas sp.]